MAKGNQGFLIRLKDEGIVLDNPGEPNIITVVLKRKGERGHQETLAIAPSLEDGKGHNPRKVG